MIEMTRLRLINWHNFQDECIPFRMVTYLIGVNAVGKTTIMDAIRYCLTTNKDFNAAGNRRSGRTLQGSIHGKQRGENIYLRPGHTVAYVGVEFFDREKNTPFVITVRVESESPSQELRHVSQDWFLSKAGVRLEDLLFVDKDRRPTKKDAFKASCPGMRAPATQKEARKQICRQLGIGDAESSIGRKFNEVFHMGTSLKEIPDIRTFIYTYILPEPEIRVEALQSDMRELERLEETLQEAQQRAKSLEAIVESGREATGLQTQVELNEGFILLAGLQKNQLLEEDLQRRSETANRELERLYPERTALEEKKNHARDEWMRALQDKDSNPEVQASKFYQDQEKQYAKDLRAQVNRQEDWYTSLRRLRGLTAAVHSSPLQDAPELPPDDFAEWPEDQQKAALDKLSSDMPGLPVKIEDAVFEYRREEMDCAEVIEAHKRELRQLRDGRMTYPEAAERLKTAVNSELAKRGMEADARILTELLYMEDDGWQECAEAALGVRRFDIIVSPSHYPAAKGVFTAMGFSVGEISLVDTPSLARDSRRWSPPDQNMLAYKIGSENHDAKQYVNYLLHEIVCCESPEELERHRRSVTKDLLRYQSYRLQRMRRPSVLYIGADARKKRAAYLTQHLEELRETQTGLSQKIQQLNKLNGTYQEFYYGRHLSCLVNNLDAREKVTLLNGQLDEIRGKLREYETNPLLAGLFDRCRACEEALNGVEKEITDLSVKINDLERTTNDAQKEITRCIDALESAQVAFDRFLLAHPTLRELVEHRYADAVRTRTPEEIEHNQQGRHNQFVLALDRYINEQLRPLQLAYNAKYTADYPTGLEGLAQYQDAYDALVRIELERSLENLRLAQVRCKERFRKEILFRMKDDIITAKAQFRALNQVMSELTYGEEKYRFLITDPRDRELAAFNQIIMDKNNVQITEDDSIFTQEAMSEPAYEAQVDELMTRIMADVDQAAADRSAGRKTASDQISKYVDYRTFLEYDILVENVTTNISVPLSQVSGDSSGGENQAPFYVAICASLLQIYRQSPNSIRLVLLDEAFNNMTSDRIEPMMKMFTATGLQLVLISTAEKCTAVYPYCDIVYSIIKTGARAVLAPFEKIYEEASPE